MGRVTGEDVGYAEETGAERRAEAERAEAERAEAERKAGTGREEEDG